MTMSLTSGEDTSLFENVCASPCLLQKWKRFPCPPCPLCPNAGTAGLNACPDGARLEPPRALGQMGVRAGAQADCNPLLARLHLDRSGRDGRDDCTYVYEKRACANKLGHICLLN